MFHLKYRKIENHLIFNLHYKLHSCDTLHPETLKSAQERQEGETVVNRSVLWFFGWQKSYLTLHFG